jgi:short subunit dehydrogenase-like uncharacterized protein
MSLGTPIFALLALFAPTRALLRMLLAAVGLAPGEGPSREVQRTGYFDAQFVATSTSTFKPRRVVVSVKGIQDPGYAETAKMLSESALCLAEDGGDDSKGGVLTPASAMGMGLVKRLRAKGMTFAVVKDSRDGGKP